MSTVRDLELKLKSTLHELQSSKQLCTKLLQEREESEVEITRQNSKYLALKEELVMLDISYQDLCAQRDELQRLVDTYTKCHDVHDVALQRIHSLETELAEANEYLQQISERDAQRESENTQALYNEVMSGVTIPTIDLTSMSDKTTTTSPPPSLMNSANKIKKYVKTNKYIKKVQKLIKKNRKSLTNAPAIRQKMQLESQVSEYQEELFTCRIDYESTISNLQAQVEDLEMSLLEITCKYSRIQTEYSDCVTTMNELITLGQTNIELVESNIRDMEDCDYRPSQPSLPIHELSGGSVILQKDPVDRLDPMVQLDPVEQPDPVMLNPVEQLAPLELLDTVERLDPVELLVPMEQLIPAERVNPVELPGPMEPCIQEKQQPTSVDSTSTLSNLCKTVIYSDKLGVGLGTNLSNNLQQVVTNVCMPNASYQQIVNSMLQQKFHENTSVVLCVGNSLGVKPDDIITFVNYILASEARKVIICAFPFSRLLSDQQNMYIYRLNLLMYNLTFGNRDRMHYFELNNFVHNCILTRDTLYVPLRSRRQIAALLACNIDDLVISNNTNVVDPKPLYSEVLRKPSVNRLSVTDNLNCQRRQQRSLL